MVTNKGPVYIERQGQCCNVSSDIALIKLLRFLVNQASRSKNGLQAHLITYDARVDDDTSNQSLMLYVNWPKARSILFTWTIRKILSVYQLC